MSGEMRYWRHIADGSVTYDTPDRPRYYVISDYWEPVYVLTAAELAAVKAEVWDEGFVTCYRYERGMAADPTNPYRADQIEKAGRRG